ncbi:MAG: hypothetical protein K2Y32_16920 [Candidatus Obscuribacterales bacterium]|jgi:hypothetical protein|nr:hypothetical protein [Candidatus Obscuribacterales bacterium]MBX9940946.1 hypothetical protein [Candidatus Obscuribacterales bacterium]
MSESITNGVALALFLYFITAQAASAYVDPSTGSYFVQILVAGLVTIGFTFKTAWRHLKAACCKGKVCGEPQQTEEAANSLPQHVANEQQSPDAG